VCKNPDGCEILHHRFFMVFVKKNPLNHKNGMLTTYQLVDFATAPQYPRPFFDRARLESSTPRRQSLGPDASLA
jgi:hypothetical protein